MDCKADLANKEYLITSDLAKNKTGNSQNDQQH